jgi:spore germination cell wall hydrolase CwlJ-like protein
MEQRMARRRAHISWAASVIAPWCLAGGALVSFTADAGQEVPSGASRAPKSTLAAVMPKDLVPSPHALTSTFGGAFGRGMLHEARLNLGAAEQIAPLPDEIEPRDDLKKNAKIFPEIDRRHKGDPLVGLRPTIDGALRHKGRSLAQIRADFLTFGQDASDLAASFAPSLEDEGGASQTMRPSAAAERASQGATPRVPRAVALGSSTPYAADRTPIRVLASTVAPRRGAELANMTSISRFSEKRDYLALIPPEKMDAEKLCLTQAIYFEARSEPEAGRAAVAQVILNRMTSGHYPSSICGVVFQNQQHYHACQFSFTCEGRTLRVRDAEAWAQATRVADDVLGGKTWVADVGDSTHYHANYVRPRWARSLKKTDVIGKHIFYRLKSG